MDGDGRHQDPNGAKNQRLLTNFYLDHEEEEDLDRYVDGLDHDEIMEAIEAGANEEYPDTESSQQDITEEQNADDTDMVASAIEGEHDSQPIVDESTGNVESERHALYNSATPDEKMCLLGTSICCQDSLNILEGEDILKLLYEIKDCQKIIGHPK